MFQALTHFANTVTWLRYLGYRGDGNFPDAPNGWERLKRLRKMVTEREPIPMTQDGSFNENDGSDTADEVRDSEGGDSESGEEVVELDEVDDLLAVMGLITLL